MAQININLDNVTVPDAGLGLVVTFAFNGQWFPFTQVFSSPEALADWLLTMPLTKEYIKTQVCGEQSAT